MRRLALALAVVLAAGLPAGPVSAGEDLTRYVDPMIGTFGSGFVFPGPAAPHGMVQLSPDTEGYFAYMGYLWSDTSIRAFSHVHVESMGVHMGGNVPFMPTTGPITSTDPLQYMSPFNHATEEASPGYYRVLLERYGIDAELTAGLRVGMHRYTFPPAAEANVLMDIGRSVPRGDDPARPGPHRAVVEVIDDRNVSGTAFTRNGYDVHFHVRFDRPFEGFSTWDRPAGEPVPGRASVDATGAGAAVTFDAMSDRDVVAKTGISFVSRGNALENLEAELPDDDFGFDALRERTRADWDDALHAIEVKGGTPGEKTSFYTALYHAQHHPNVFTDADGTYMGHDGAVHAADGYTHYANFSLWDTYRGQMQLLATIAPDRYRDMLRSLVSVHEQQGRLPRWALQNRSPDYMMGDPALISIADGICRGIADPALEDDLYAAMRYAVLEAPRDPDVHSLGYIPHDRTTRGASATLENALAYFSLALVADRRGEAADRDAALRFANSWANLQDPDGWIRPRYADGSWMDPYHPELPDGYQEGTGWQWSWMVPHDVDALFDGMDGKARERLDTHFSSVLAERVPGVVPEVQKHITAFGIAYYGNQYAPSNEHELHAPYLYDWVGAPSVGQGVLRGLQQLYRPTPDGIPGNDDLGSMSSWFVWSALGFYPAVGGAPGFAIGSPLFEGATIRLPDGGFDVRAPGASLVAKYIASATLDGEPLDRTWFGADRIAPGGEITFEMSPTASSWASGPGAAPPSISADPIEAFGCRG